MNEENKEGVSYLSMVLNMVANAIKGKIIANSSDLVSLVFFNAAVKNNTTGFDHIHVLQGLEGPSAEIIKRVHTLAREQKHFEATIGHVSERKCDFSQALWTCSNLFAESALKNCYKRIMLFTNSDDPSLASPDKRMKILQKGKDLEDLEIQMELFAFNRSDHVFDHKKLFRDLLMIDLDDTTGTIAEKTIESLAELETTFRKKEYKKRALGTVPLNLSPDLAINVKIYCLLRTATKDYGQFLDSKTNEPLNCVTQFICSETGAVLEDHQIKTYHLYGGEKVFFKKEEMKQLKDFGEPSFTLMGFKPQDRLKFYHNVKNPYFIYPDESTLKGSTVAFNALIIKLAEQKKLAIARMIYRRGGIPRFVALLPQTELHSPDGLQLRPPGMHVIFLPYADDIRNLKLEPTPIAEGDLVNKAKQVIHSMPARFDNTTFENPALQKHYATLQALALEEDIPDTIEDITLPDKTFAAKLSGPIGDFADAAGVPAAVEEDEEDFGGDEDGEGGGGSSKRKAPSSSSSSSRSKAAPKKKARAAPVADDSGIDWEAKVKDGSIKKLTIPVLKEYLRANSLPLSGKKDDLLQRIRDHMGV